MLNKHVIAVIITAISVNFARAQQGGTVKFPVVSKPLQITENGKDHLFASYYGINSWSKNQRYVTVLETDVRYKIPNETEPATLGLVDLETNKFIPLTQTHAWNLQQGCMAHWLATNPDSVIIYNDLRNGKYVSVILNVLSRKEIKTIAYPIAAVSPDGKQAVSINFARIHITRTDYGYGGNGQDARLGVSFPQDDGVFLVDLETGKAKLIVSYTQLKALVPAVPLDGLEYINHALFSRNGKQLYLIARATPQLNTISLTVNTDGTDLQRCFPDGWGGSHFDWLNDGRLLITAQYEGKQYGHILFTPGKNDYQRLGKGLLDYDGHGTFSPDGKWLVTDTYPNILGEQRIFLMDMHTQAILPLGIYPEPPVYSQGWRCDIHCRWSPKGDMIGFNSSHTGSRQVYIMKLQ